MWKCLPVILAFGRQRQEEQGVQSHPWLHSEVEVNMATWEPWPPQKMREKESFQILTWKYGSFILMNNVPVRIEFALLLWKVAANISATWLFFPSPSKVSSKVMLRSEAAVHHMQVLGKAPSPCGTLPTQEPPKLQMRKESWGFYFSPNQTFPSVTVFCQELTNSWAGQV